MWRAGSASALTVRLMVQAMIVPGYAEHRWPPIGRGMHDGESMQRLQEQQLRFYYTSSVTASSTTSSTPPACMSSSSSEESSCRNAEAVLRCS